MSGKAMEKFFKTVFVIGIILAVIFAIGIFLLILKIILLFVPELYIMGMTIV
ncbi:MAG: hypothetical protein WCV41_01550 [Patescibacteria group bacterium]